MRKLFFIPFLLSLTTMAACLQMTLLHRQTERGATADDPRQPIR